METFPKRLDGIFFQEKEHIEPLELVYVLPISGNRFPSQIAMLLFLKNMVPNLVLSASGGNVSAYIALASNFSHDSIKRICCRMHHSDFIERSLILDPKMANFITKGHIYTHSKTFTRFFSTVPKAKLSSVEIISSVYNIKSRQCEMYSNFSNEDSLLKTINHMNYDHEFISQIIVASANIPLLLPEIIVRNEKLVDSGVMMNSPIPLLQNTLKKKINKIVYFFPGTQAFESINEMSTVSILDTMGFALNYIDLMSISALESFTERSVFIRPNNLSMLKREKYIAVFFPLKQEDFDILSFTYGDLNACIEKYSRNLGLYLIS